MKGLRAGLLAVLCLLLLLGMAACSGSKTGEEDAGKKNEKSSEECLDLTKMSSTAIFSEVSNMLTRPEDYVGRKVKIKGMFAVAANEKTGEYHFYCVVPDATQCCRQGLEFVWRGENKYPEDYPAEGIEVTVEGTFDVYKASEDDQGKYVRLKDANLSW